MQASHLVIWASREYVQAQASRQAFELERATKRCATWMDDSSSDDAVGEAESKSSETLPALPSVPALPCTAETRPRTWAGRVQLAFKPILQELGCQRETFRVATACSGTGAVTYALEDRGSCRCCLQASAVF